MPLAILRPDMYVVLVDSIQKKLTFIEDACRELGADIPAKDGAPAPAPKPAPRAPIREKKESPWKPIMPEIVTLASSSPNRASTQLCTIAALSTPTRLMITSIPL